MGDEREVEVEVLKPKKQREYEERMMRALAAINGNLSRIADATETVAEALKNGAQVESPINAAIASLGHLFNSPDKKKKGGRRR